LNALEKAKQLGISEQDLKQALLLVRNLRLQALQQNIDPRATRIALIFAELTDKHFAQQKLDPYTLCKLTQIAHQLYEETKQKQH